MMVKSNKYIQIINTVSYDIYGVNDKFEKLGIREWMGWSKQPKQPDAVLAIGGDGAVLKASKETTAPIIGWNQGSLGFLTTGKELYKILRKWLNNKLLIDSRRRLEVNIDFKYWYALNEIAVVGKETGSLVETEMYIDDKNVSTFKGDGLIVATPTGSTAWSMSAGGSLVEKGISCMLLTPMNPFTMNVRPLIISGQHEVVLKNVQKVVIDGYDKVIPKADTIIIRYDNHPVIIYRENEENFFEGITEKLNWNQNIKN